MTASIKEMIDTLKDQGATALLDGVSDVNVKVFELKHGVALPEQYKEWLRVTDGGELFLPAGVQFYGVNHKPLIDVDDDDRPDEDYVVIGALATGDPIIFKKGTEEVAIYNHEAGMVEDDEKYVDFCSFLNNLPAILGLEV